MKSICQGFIKLRITRIFSINQAVIQEPEREHFYKHGVNLECRFFKGMKWFKSYKTTWYSNEGAKW